MKKHRLLFVGAGRVADVHHVALQTLAPRCTLAGFCEIRAEARTSREQEWSAPGFADLGLALRSVRPDAAIILLPHDAHLAAVRSCLEAGVPVLLEKPLAIDLGQAQAIKDLVGSSRVRLMLGHNGLFHPAFEAVAEVVARGWIGRPLSARAESCGWLDFKPWDFRLRAGQTGGGAWMDTGSHLVYSLRHLLGPVSEVQALTGKLARSEMEGEDHAMVSLRFASGALGQIFVSYGLVQPGRGQAWPAGYRLGFEIAGDRGAVRYRICPEPLAELYSEVPSAPDEARRSWMRLGGNDPFTISFARQMAHFLDGLEGGARFRCEASDGLETLHVLRAAYSSEGCTVRVP